MYILQKEGAISSPPAAHQRPTSAPPAMHLEAYGPPPRGGRGCRLMSSGDRVRGGGKKKNDKNNTSRYPMFVDQDYIRDLMSAANFAQIPMICSICPRVAPHVFLVAPPTSPHTMPFSRMLTTREKLLHIPAAYAFRDQSAVACMHMHAHVHIHEHKHTCTHANACTHAQTHMHAHACTSQMQACTHVHMHKQTCTIQTRMHSCARVH
jgi:hypothetical protein